MACGKAGSADLGQSRAPAPLCKEAKLSTPRFAERQRLGGVCSRRDPGCPRPGGEGGCRCLLRLEAAGSAGVGSARRDWVPLGKCDGLLDQRPPTEGNVQAGVCFAKVIAALVIQQIQRGAKTLTRNARLRGASVAGSAAGPSSCSAAQAAIPRR